LVFFAGCSVGPNPKEVLSKFLENYFHDNYDNAYEFLSSKDKAVKSKQEFSKDFKKSVGQAFAGKITFNIKDVKVMGDKALATVDITTPDLSGVMGEVFGVAMKSAFSGGKVDEKEMKIVAEKMKDKNMPTTTRTELYDLVKDKDGWRIYMGWADVDKITKLTQEARDLDYHKKYAEVKSKYYEILVLSSRNEEALKRMRQIDKDIAERKKELDYFPYVEVRHLKIEKSSPSKIIVSGELKNKGDKSLKFVQVTTYGLDKNGNNVFEDKAFPAILFTDDASLRDFQGNKLLKANYSNPFSYHLNTTPPSDWTGKVKVEVTDLEFE
jgi:hypothetical protein